MITPIGSPQQQYSWYTLVTLVWLVIIKNSIFLKSMKSDCLKISWKVVKITVMWDATPCSLLGCYRRFRGTCQFQLQCRRVPWKWRQQSSQTLASFYQITHGTTSWYSHLCSHCHNNLKCDKDLFKGIWSPVHESRIILNFLRRINHKHLLYPNIYILYQTL
jgi:hypothetical protein